MRLIIYNYSSKGCSRKRKINERSDLEIHDSEDDDEIVFGFRTKRVLK
jgi:hypothetical protein